MAVILVLAAAAVMAAFILIRLGGRKPASADIPKKKKSRAKGAAGFLAVSSVFWAVGIPMLAGSFMMKAKAERYIAYGTPADAVIADIKEYRVIDVDEEYKDVRDVYLHYTIDGTGYDNVIKDADVYGAAVGGTLRIYCLPDDPTDFICSENIENKLAFTLPAGAVLTLLPFAVRIGTVHIRKREEHDDLTF